MNKKTTKKKAKKSKGTFLGKALIAAADDAIAWHKGEKELRVTDVEIDPPPEFSKTKIKKLRKQLNLSQPVFAEIMGFSPGAIKSWEQGKTPPLNARRMLQILTMNNEIINKILHQKTG